VTGQRVPAKAVTGLVTAVHGRHYAVELPDGHLLHCFPRGRNTSYACGDIVDVEPSGDLQGTIRSHHPRTSLLYRSDRYRQKIIAANVTQVLIVVAAEPPFSEQLLMRCLIVCEHQRIKAIIALNKIDLVDEAARVARQLALYAELGYAVVELSAATDISPLASAVRGHRNVLVGQSGMGKSTIVNALIPGAQARTAEISRTLHSGKHTTTSAHLYHLDAQTEIIDSPGLQTFGLLHLSESELVSCFPEFTPFVGRCRFDDCRHTVEPGCAVIAGVKSHQIAGPRWRAYCDLMNELESKPPDWALERTL